MTLNLLRKRLLTDKNAPKEITMKRVILVIPEIENGKEITQFFLENNPDSRFVDIHICLVFPFDGELSTEEMSEIMQMALGKAESFEIELTGFSISFEETNNFLFLDVNDKNNFLKQISTDLYHELQEVAKLKGDYTPHITIGKSNSVEDIKQMQREVLKINDIKCKAKISKVYSKLFEENELGEIMLRDELEIRLNS